MSIINPTVTAKAIWRNVASGMIATSANVAAKITPAVVIARDVRGSASMIASASGLRLAASQIDPTEKTV